MNLRSIQYFLFTAIILASTTACAGDMGGGAGFQRDFDLKSCTMKTTGKAPYFIMEPGYQIVIEDEETKVQITVLDETKMVDGIETRVIEEREWVDGELYEVSMNYFAMCEQTKDVFYFGEHVDFYEKKQGRQARRFLACRRERQYRGVDHVRGAKGWDEILSGDRRGRCDGPRRDRQRQ